MDMFVVQGGRPLRGRVAVSGSKNATLPIMAAALAIDGPTVLHNVPRLADVDTLCELLASLGMDVQIDAAVPDAAGGATLRLHPRDPAALVADYELVRRMRASICVLGPLLARRGRACVSLPGGCNIGDRPVDLHLKGLRALGAEIRVERGYIIAHAKRLRGARVYLGGPYGSTVTGTCNVLAAATLAEGCTVIEAAACEPEVVDFGQFLVRAGAEISGLGTPFVTVHGVRQLHAVEHTVVADRIEAATLMMAAAITGGNIELEHVPQHHLTAVIEKLADIGVHIEGGCESLRVLGTGPRRNSDCIALPYPGLPTDAQAQLTALLSCTPGMSVVTDRIFPDRFMHVAELKRMGAQIRREGPSAIISGVPQLSAASVMASDLRASAALVLAALSAPGQSVVRRVYHLDRGYERLDEKLNCLGADIDRVEDTPENLPRSLREVSELASVPPLDGPKWLRHLAPNQARTPTANHEMPQPNS